MKKLFLTLALLLSVLLMSLPVAASITPFISIPSGETKVKLDGKDYKVIRTVDDFLAMKEAGNYILANDIDFGNTSYTTYLVTLAAGTVIEGNGYAIYGFTIEAAANAAPFGLSVGDVITFRNLTVGQSDKPVSITSIGSGMAVGGIVSDVNKAVINIENCTVYADLKCESGNVGGMIGLVVGTQTHSIKGCSFYGTAIGKYSGGIAGQQKILSFFISDCKNYGTIITSADDGASGGIVGKCLAINNNDAISGCVNLGSIDAGKNYAGGLFGWFDGAANVLVVNDFVNVGKISGEISGGVMGFVTASSLNLDRCVNAGVVNGSIVGGMVGNAQGAKAITIKNSSSYGKLMGTTAGIMFGSVAETAIAAENNKYLSMSGISTVGTDKATAKTAAEAVAELNKLTIGLTFTEGAGNDAGYPVLLKSHAECIWDAGEEKNHTAGCPDGKAILHHCTIPGCTETWLEYKEHTPKEVISKEASCGEAGKKQVVCEVCNYVIKEEIIPALAHNWSEWSEVRPATIDQEGEQQRVCSICQKTETKKIAKLKADTTTAVDTTVEQKDQDKTKKSCTSNSGSTVILITCIVIPAGYTIVNFKSKKHI